MIVEFDLFKELQVVLDVSFLKSAFIQFGREICPPKWPNSILRRNGGQLKSFSLYYVGTEPIKGQWEKKISKMFFFFLKLKFFCFFLVTNFCLPDSNLCAPISN